MSIATGVSTALFACSKCFSRHPFEELSQGQQLCKECRGAFPIVKCTYCRSEFQQESKNNTSSICKKCEHNVKKYGKPTSCQCCSIIASFVDRKCHRCHESYRKYGPPKSCQQCKQKCAFDREEHKNAEGKLLCWLCSLSYKRALVRTKQSDPSRHSRVFKQTEKEKKSHKEKSSHDKYFNHKKPQRPDVTLMTVGADEPSSKRARLSSFSKSDTHKRSHHHKEHYHHLSGSSNRITSGVASGDTDHVGEITQLKEKIASLTKQLTQKDRELVTKAAEMTALKAKLFNEEKLIKEKLKRTGKINDDKLTELQAKINKQNIELVRLRRGMAHIKGAGSSGNARRSGLDQLFPDTVSGDMIILKRNLSTKVDTASSRSQSPTLYPASNEDFEAEEQVEDTPSTLLEHPEPSVNNVEEKYSASPNSEIESNDITASLTPHENDSPETKASPSSLTLNNRLLDNVKNSPKEENENFALANFCQDISKIGVSTEQIRTAQPLLKMHSQISEQHLPEIVEDNGTNLNDDDDKNSVCSSNSSSSSSSISSTSSSAASSSRSS